MGKKRLILDTNILISAFSWNGNERKVFHSVAEGRFELLVSSKQFEDTTILNTKELPEIL